MEDFQYFGLFLDSDTRDRLISVIKEINNSIIDDADKVYLDHCTLLHKSQIQDNPELYTHLEIKIGEEIPIMITSIGMSDKAFAFKVLVPIFGMSANMIPHITIATYKGGKPVDSNDIPEWEPIKPIEVITRLEKR